MAGKTLENRVAIVTGGSSGIGAASVALFLSEGAKVIIADLNEAEAPAADSGRCRFVRCDVTSEADVAALVGQAQEIFGGLDILFNNAGAGGIQAPIADMTVDGWDAVMALNLRAAMLGIKHAAPLMRARGGGSIINTSSIAGQRTGISSVAYSVAKAANIQLTQMAAAEFASANIRINAICPGIIPAGSVGGMLGLTAEAMERLTPEIARIFGTAQPLPRAGRPEDIAQTALFLASDASQWLTGQAIAVDGGMLLKGPNTLDLSLPGNVVGQLFQMRDDDLARSNGG